MHSSFKLNGISFPSEKELINFSETNNKSLYSFLTAWFDEKDYLVVHTSGSTGKPKPIKLQKAYMINSAMATGAFFDVKEHTKALLCLSIDYIAGKMMLVRALTLGWDIDVVAPVSNPLAQLTKEYDFSAMVPMQLQNSLQELDMVKKLIVGGGVVSNTILHKLRAIKTQVFATYGMTETITHIAVKRLNNFNQKPSFYQTLPDVKIGIDQRNCLVIQAPKVSDGLLVTNDIVQLVAETSFQWLGRFDNIINSGGVKLNPEKIEEKLARIIDRRFFVIGIPDEVLGEKLIVIVEGDSYDIKLDRVKSLSTYELPKAVYFIPNFIETATKKIQRKETLAIILEKNQK